MFDFQRSDLAMIEAGDALALHFANGKPHSIQVFQTSYREIEDQFHAEVNSVMDQLEALMQQGIIVKWGRLVESNDLSEPYLWVQRGSTVYVPIPTSSIYKTGGNTYYKFI